MSNWQDQWENNKVTFDGLIDFKGRKKSVYEKFIKTNSSDVVSQQAKKIEILVPSILIYPNDKVTYHALMLQDNKWVYPEPLKYQDEFEWVLVKNDSYGNALAIKELGNGVSKTITVPDNYINYELVLVHNYSDIVSLVKTQLNTKIINIPGDIR